MAGLILEQGLTSLAVYNGTLIAWLKTLQLGLFKNNHAPTVTDTDVSYTAANFDGYALTAAITTWTLSGFDANANLQYTNADITFTMTGSVTPNQIYGYYLYDGTHIVMAEANGVSGGVAMAGAGYTYTVSLNFYLGQILTPV